MSAQGIRARGESWIVDVTYKGQRRTSTVKGLDRRDEAEKVRVSILAELMNGTSAPKVKPQVTSWTMQEAFTHVQTVWAGTGGEDCQVRNAQFAVDFFGASTPLADITCEWMDSYLARLKQIGNSNSTINKKISAVSFMMTQAIQRGRLKAKPHMGRLKEGVGRIRFLTQDEEMNATGVLSQWGKDDHAEALTVLIDTGLRLGELWKLEVRDIDFLVGVLHVWVNKTEHPRSVPMTQRVRTILERRREYTKTGKLFPFDNFWFEHVWNRMKVHLGLEYDEQFVPYALRHTCASRLVQRGVHLQVVKEWMGHKAIQTTLRYAHLCPKNLLDAAKVLENC